VILPRFIRLRDAPTYLGVDRNRFNAEIRPTLTEIPIGVQGVAFDRLDLDAWADDYIRRNGRAPGRKGDSWGISECQDSASLGTLGTSRNGSEAMARFEKARKQARSKKPNGTSSGA
jgi:hypothetical protein